MNHWMFRCQDVSRKVSQSMDVQLPLHQRMAIRIHLIMCRYCTRFRRQMLTIRKICQLKDQGQPTEKTPETLSKEAKKRVKEKLRSLH